MGLMSSVLLPYQQRWAADRSQVKVAEKSRRVGLTWAEAADSALTAAEARGQDTWYIGYTKDMALEFIETVAKWARAFDLAAAEIEDAGEVLEDDDKDKGVLAYKVRFASGHKVVALSSRPTNLRGKQGRVVLDEFAFHPEPGELLKAAMALLIWGGCVNIISTHNGEENPFNELIQDILAGRVEYSLHRITFDDALAEGLYRRVCERTGELWSPAAEAEWRQKIITFYRDNADEELHCVPRSGGGAYIPRVLIEQRMVPVPVIRYQQPASFAQLPKVLREAEVDEWCRLVLGPLLETLDPRLLSYFGEDFGRHIDLTVIWPLQLRNDLVRVTPFIVELGRIPFEQQRQILFYIVDRLPRFVYGAMDRTGNGAYLAEVAMQRYGSGRIAEVHLSVEWYRDNMPRYKAGFEDAKVLIPKDADVLNDFGAVRLYNGVPRVPENARTKMASGQQRHGDAAIAGALAYAATHAEVTEYDYTPVARKARAMDDDAADHDDVRLTRRAAY